MSAAFAADIFVPYAVYPMCKKTEAKIVRNVKIAFLLYKLNIILFAIQNFYVKMILTIGWEDSAMR